MIETPKDLESYMQYVYSCLLNLQNEGVVVSRRAVLKGRVQTMKLMFSTSSKEPELPIR